MVDARAEGGWDSGEGGGKGSGVDHSIEPTMIRGGGFFLEGKEGVLQKTDGLEEEGLLRGVEE